MKKAATTRMPVARGLVLLLFVICSYLPATRAGFIWDDDDYVTHNSTLRDLKGLGRIWFEPGAVPQYYPLVHTTFWIEEHLWDLRPAGYHLVNILLHALAAFLLWRCLVLLRVPGSWFVAALFALHPLQVESVAWVTERKNVLSAVFYFLALLAWLRIPEGAPGQDRSRVPARRWYFLSLAAFLCALLSKTVAGTLPAAILLIEYWKTGRIARRTLLRLLSFVLLAAVAGMVTITMERESVRAVGPDWDLSFLERVQIAGRALWFYPFKLLLPVRLSFVYPRWAVGGPDPAGLFAFAAFLALLFVLYKMRARLGRGLLCGVLFYAVTIFPALGFFNIYPMRYTFVADHYQYLAGIGILAAVTGVVLAGVSLAGKERSSQRTGPVAAVAVLVVLGFISWNRARVFENQETLWLDTIEKNSGAWMAHNNLGKYYEDAGRPAEAAAQYRAALGIRSDLDKSLYNLANLEAAAGDLAGAEGHYRQALRANPQFAEAWNNLGNTLRATNRMPEAVEAYRRAVALDPAYVAARKNLGISLADTGDIGGAIEHLRKAVEGAPNDADACSRLAWLLATAGDEHLRDGGEACDLAERALRRGGESPQALTVLSAAYAEAGRFPDAVAAAERALRAARSSSPAMQARIEQYLAEYRAGKAIRAGK